MKSLAEGEAMDDDILKTLKKSTNKQKQIIQEKKTASGSVESKVSLLAFTGGYA